MLVEDGNDSIGSKASFLDLKRECFKLIKSGYIVSAVNFPNISILADEYGKSLENLDLQEYALVLGFSNKIEFVREARRRYNLPLKEAKILQEGMWKRLGWDQLEQDMKKINRLNQETSYER